MKAVLLVASLFMFALPATVQAKTLTIVSDKNWMVFDSNGLQLGNAQHVCRDKEAPEGCPPGAMLFGSPLWVPLPGANWIWAPNTTETSNPRANEPLTFKFLFPLCGSPQSANISIAADDSTEVFINGTLILSVQNFSAVTNVSIPAARLVQGLNFIEVRVTNATNAPGCSQYKCNPAGVILKLTATDNLDPWPTCQDGRKTAQVGEFQDQSCPPGQVGSNSRVCVCVGNFATWWSAFNSCHTPPVTCLRTNNTPASVNDTEPVSCSAPLVGSAFRTCQSTGQWSSPDFSGCKLPTVGVGEMCRDRNKIEIATCPSGTECQPRRFPPSPRPWYCAFFGIGCPSVRLQTSEWFCDP